VLHQVADDVDDGALRALPEMRQHRPAHVVGRAHRAFELRLVVGPGNVTEQLALLGSNEYGRSALFTTTSMRPSSATVCATISCTSDGAVTSAFTAHASPPAALHWATTSLAAASLRR